MKLELTNDTKIAIWKIGNAALMCQDNDITSAKYEEISLEAMNEANGAHLKNSNCNIPLVINWVAITEHLPEEAWGDYMVCLENNAIFKANYSRIGTERWLIVGVGDTKETNPVKYWAELPEPPCL